MKSWKSIIALAALPSVNGDGIACIQAITKTVAYEAALRPHGTVCPVNTAQGISYYLVNNGGGCCTSTAQVATVGTEGAACCPCGAQCTGFMPAMYEWSTGANGFTASPTESGSGTRPTSTSRTADATTMVVPTTSPSSPLSTTLTGSNGTNLVPGTTSTSTGAVASTSTTTGSSSSSKVLPGITLPYVLLLAVAIVIVGL